MTLSRDATSPHETSLPATNLSGTSLHSTSAPGGDDLAVAVPFGERLAVAFQEYGHLCVGIDPHPYLLEKWGLPDSATGARDLALHVVDAASGVAGLVKPQIAFFERYGAAGYTALEEVIAAARASGIIVIADAKRGDIGTSCEAYGEAWLKPGSPMEADALTVVAYQGVGSLTATLNIAEHYGKGVFVLAATSNPEALRIQTASIRGNDGDDVSVARAIIDDVNAWNTRNNVVAAARLGAVGYVFGATVDADAYGISRERAPAPVAPVLVPGFGFQGAAIDEVHHILGGMADAAVLSQSRSLLMAGQEGIRSAIVDGARAAAYG